MKPAPLIRQLDTGIRLPLVPQTEVQKVVGRLGDLVGEEFKDDPAGWARVDGDVEEWAGVGGHGARRFLRVGEVRRRL